MFSLQCLTLCCILAAVAVATMIVVRSLYIREKRELLTEQANALALFSQSGDSAGAEALAEAAAAQHDLLVRMDYENEASIFYFEEKWAACAQISPFDEEYAELISKASDEMSFETNLFGDGLDFPTLSGYRRVESGAGSGLVSIHTDLSDTEARLTQLLTWIGAIALISIIAAVLSSYYAASRIINPFVEINHTVQCYSRGDFSKRIHLPGKDEAAQLGKSFNEMAEQLRSLEETRRSFVANVSHELRSPLTSMKGFLEAMYDGTIPKKEQEHYIGLVLSETKRMTVMVNDLLDLARIESGNILLNYETFDINELIRRTLITFEARFVEKNIDLDVRFAQEQCFVYADSTQISQVLRNLIDNALKYSPDDSMIYISSYALRKEVYVSIRDTGVGIPQEDVPHVFDRFYKVEKAHTPSPQVGSGLGLSIVKRIIEQHGQTITVRSAKGKGTQFTFSLQKAHPFKRSMDGGKKNG